MKKSILKIGILITTLFLSIAKVEAASFTISSNATYLTKGGAATLTIRGSDVTGRFNITSSNSSIVSISEDRAWIENDSYQIKLSALNVGTATITVTPSGVSDGNGNNVNLGAKSIKITVSLPREKSNDNNLKNLSIEEYEISPAFDKDVQVYNAIVPEGTKKIKINAEKNEAHASVEGAGEQDVTNGINTFNIVVKSETGKEKIYTLNVEVKDNNPILVNVDGTEYSLIKLRENLEAKSTFEEHSVNINGYEIPALINRSANIILVGLKDKEGNIKYFSYSNGSYSSFDEISLKNYQLVPIPFTTPLDLIKTTISINNITYDAYKYSEKSDFAIINAKNLEDGKTALYLYDTKNKTAQLYDETYIKESNETIKNYSYIILAFAGALVLMLILIFILLHSLHKKQKKINKFLKKQEAKIEATRKLNDVVSEVQKITAAEKQKEEKNKSTKKEKENSVKIKAEEKNLEPQKTKKELKKEAKEKKKNKKEPEEIKVKEIQASDPNNEIKKVLDDSEEVYNLFDDDKKKKKKK